VAARPPLIAMPVIAMSRLARPRGRLLVAMAALAAVLAAPGPARGAEQVLTLSPRPGVTLRYVLVPTPGPPVASAILFVGGDGVMNLDRPRDRWSLKGNFLFRTRSMLTEQGVQLAIVDAPSDRPSTLWGFRSGEAHATDIAAVLAALRSRTAVPAWLIGTSAGTVSAANGAVRLRAPAGPDGVVLTSTIFKRTRVVSETVPEMDLARVQIPVLLVHHQNDDCVATRYVDLWALERALPRSIKHETLLFKGGDPARSEPCEAQSPHGYLGIEREVMTAIGRWMLAAVPRP